MSVEATNPDPTMDSAAPDVDLTVELITHRFTEASRAVLLSWYPHEARSRRSRAIGEALEVRWPQVRQATLPQARLLYWT